MPRQDLPPSGDLVEFDKHLQETLAKFGTEVKKSRVTRGLSQETAAVLAGVSQSNWSKVERGTVDPSLGLVLRIQMALNAPSIESFFGDFPSASVLDRPADREK